MKPRSSSKALPAIVVFAAMAATTSAWPQSAPVLEANTIEFSSSNVFQTFGNGSRYVSEMRARLEDPQQRAALRDEQRANLLESHYGVAEALGLSDATYTKLIDLLADQQLAQLEEFHLRIAPRAEGRDLTENLHGHAERMTQNIQALREVLGQRKLECYQQIQPSLGQRREVRKFDDVLSTPHKLSAAQRERLVELFHKQNMRDIQLQSVGLSARRSLGETFQKLPSREEMQRHSQLMTIAANEVSWRRMPESHRLLREQAAEILTPSQLSVLEGMHAERERSLQRRIEQMRVQAGLSSTIPDQPELAEVPAATVAGTVKISLELAVDRAEPKQFSVFMSSGSPVSFELGAGLHAEAMVTLYTDDAYDLRVNFYEFGTTGKRLIGNMGSLGTILRTPPRDDVSSPFGGRGSTVIAGNRGYVIQMSEAVEAI